MPDRVCSICVNQQPRYLVYQRSSSETASGSQTGAQFRIVTRDRHDMAGRIHTPARSAKAATEHDSLDYRLA